jgi:hypothetical protein
MSSASSMFEVGAACLGYIGLVATWRRSAPPAHATIAPSRVAPQLIIQSCATTDDGAYEPAQSITIGSKEGLLALRAAIDEALKEYTL